MTIQQMEPPEYVAEEERTWRQRTEEVIVDEGVRLMEQMAEAASDILRPLRLWETRALKLFLEKLDAGGSFHPMPSDINMCLQKGLAWQVEHEVLPCGRSASPQGEGVCAAIGSR